MLLDQYHMMQNTGPTVGMNSEDLKRAIEHLYNAIQILTGCHKTMVDGVLEYGFSQDLADSWHEVNKCRLYTEEILFIEEVLIPCMGSINDAKSMFDSLIAQKLGMTKHGYINILMCMNDAIVGLSGCLEELESWMEPA